MAVPESFAAAEAIDLDGRAGPDLWLLRQGRSIEGACTDVNSDGIWDVALRERYGELLLEIDGDRDALPDFKSYLRIGTTEDFRRMGPSLMINPYSDRPHYARQLQYEAEIGSGRSLEMLNFDGMMTVRLDSDGDGFREIRVSHKDGRLVDVKYLGGSENDMEESPLVWLNLSNEQPFLLGWSTSDVRVIWDIQTDLFSIDRNGDGKIDEVVPARNVKPDSYRIIMDSLAGTVSALLGAR